MPYVNIKVTDENVTPEQKSQLIKGVTDLLFDVLGKAPDSTYVVIDEVALTDWGVGGVNVAEYRAQRAARG
ncbi:MULTISPECIES: tautomerase family protein [Nocardia]|uniref:tautomerase family protein n=1 Tax=Nocardia ignorata TaxID=145285 RepID=UPI003627815E